ncbi:MAG TPA: hypothetical protein VN873_08445 [Candidatus Angelobacter sp.]|nr:hypothetical protein [Candidatus Angelobacter sp.]
MCQKIVGFFHFVWLTSTVAWVSYGADPFGQYSFANLYDGGPWLYFNTNYDTFSISAATNYEVAGPATTGEKIAFGVNSAITQLPAGFTHRAILTAQNGINQCYTTWVMRSWCSPEKHRRRMMLPSSWRS